MKLSTKLRAHLRANPDGFAQSALCDHFSSSTHTMRESLVLMGDAYIDRWAPRQITGKVVWEPVWCVVEVPEDCPRPDNPPTRGEVNLLELVRELQPVTISELCEATGMTESRIRKHMAKRPDVFVCNDQRLSHSRGGARTWRLR